MSKQNRDQLIKKAEGFIQWLDRQIDGLEAKADLRHRLAAGCFEMVLEHQKAIVLLIAKNLHGSAFALVRPLFESYVRGVWLHQCATDADLEKFAKGQNIGTFGALCAAVENLDGFKDGLLSDLKKKSWSAMSGFTHTGMEQITRRHTEETIEANYDEGEILEALNFACGTGWLAAIAVCELAGDAVLASTVSEKVKKLFPLAA